MARSELDRRLRQLETLRAMAKRLEESDDEVRIARVRASIRETEMRVNDMRGLQPRGKQPAARDRED